jgi:hypothetical protein
LNGSADAISPRMIDRAHDQRHHTIRPLARRVVARCFGESHKIGNRRGLQRAGPAGPGGEADRDLWCCRGGRYRRLPAVEGAVAGCATPKSQNANSGSLRPRRKNENSTETAFAPAAVKNKRRNFTSCFGRGSPGLDCPQITTKRAPNRHRDHVSPRRCATPTAISSPPTRPDAGGQGKPDQFGEAPRSHLVHDARAVDLDRARADRKIIRDCFVGQPR